MIASGLTPNESLVLLVLMTQARELTNAELKERGPELPKKQRDHLLSLGLIEVDNASRPMTVVLSENGWAHCTAEFAAAPPPRSDSRVRAIYTMMNALNVFFEGRNFRPNEVFAPIQEKTQQRKDAPTPASQGDPEPPVAIDVRIRTAYSEIAEPGRWVSLADLRPKLSDVETSELDRALVLMNRTPGVTLIPEENQKSLTPAKRAAAVSLAGQDNHLIAIASQ